MLVRCDGSGHPVSSVGTCLWCGQVVDVDGEGNAVEHQREVERP